MGTIDKQRNLEEIWLKYGLVEFNYGFNQERLRMAHYLPGTSIFFPRGIKYSK